MGLSSALGYNVLTFISDFFKPRTFSYYFTNQESTGQFQFPDDPAQGGSVANSFSPIVFTRGFGMMIVILIMMLSEKIWFTSFRKKHATDFSQPHSCVVRLLEVKQEKVLLFFLASGLRMLQVPICDYCDGGVLRYRLMPWELDRSNNSFLPGQQADIR